MTNRKIGAEQQLLPSESTDSQDQPERRILRAIADAADCFLAGGGGAQSIQAGLTLLGEATAVSRVYVFQNCAGRGSEVVACQLYEWTAPGVTPQIDHPALKALPMYASGYGRWLDVLRRGEPVYGLVADFPSAERGLLSEQEIRSLAVVPIRTSAGWWGFLGFDDCWSDRKWTTLEVDALKIAANVLGAAIEGRQGQLALQNAHDALEARVRQRTEELAHSNMALQAEIEERKRAEVRAEQARRLESLGILAGGVAHDFNNLLVSMLGNADLALEELPPNSPAREYIVEVLTAAQRAADLTRQLLDYAGKGTFTAEPVDLSVAVREVAGLLRVSVPKSVEFCFSLAQGLPRLDADRSAIRQVIMNLITNAAEAMSDRAGLIHLRTGTFVADRSYLSQTILPESVAEGEYVFVEVEDAGCGMDAETQRRAFDPFFTTKFAGRGLGLAATLGIVRGHRGTAEIDSVPGQGTTFRILFPLSHEPLKVPLAAQPEEHAAAGEGAVLVVDDEEAVRTLAKRALEKSGFGVIAVSSGREAMEVVCSGAKGIVAVLLDLTMPEMSGDELLSALHRLRPEAPIVLTSGYSEEIAASRVTPEIAARFLQKPFTPAQLVSAIKAVIARPESPV